MPKVLPPIEHRFSATNQPKYKPGPKGPMLLPLLRRLLEKNIKYKDPETKKMITGKVKDVILLRLIANASKGEHQAIKEILDRVDGKVAEQLKLDRTDEELLESELEIIPNGDKPAAIERYKRFIS
jgi:hypothetical protein